MGGAALIDQLHFARRELDGFLRDGAKIDPFHLQIALPAEVAGAQRAGQVEAVRAGGWGQPAPPHQSTFCGFPARSSTVSCRCSRWRPISALELTVRPRMTKVSGGLPGPKGARRSKSIDQLEVELVEAQFAVDGQLGLARAAGGLDGRLDGAPQAAPEGRQVDRVEGQPGRHGVPAKGVQQLALGGDAGGDIDALDRAGRTARGLPGGRGEQDHGAVDSVRPARWRRCRSPRRATPGGPAPGRASPAGPGRARSAARRPAAPGW